MNRTEFMERLERLLWDIPEQERREALQYYNDYFDDAGPENEAQVIRELGSPARVAETIRQGMSENGEYTERGFEDTRFRNHQDVSTEYQDIVVENASGLSGRRIRTSGNSLPSSCCAFCCSRSSFRCA